MIEILDYLSVAYAFDCVRTTLEYLVAFWCQD